MQFQLVATKNATFSKKITYKKQWFGDEVGQVKTRTYVYA